MAQNYLTPNGPKLCTGGSTGGRAAAAGRGPAVRGKGSGACSARGAVTGKGATTSGTSRSTGGSGGVRGQRPPKGS